MARYRVRPQKPCHREGCANAQRRGRSYLYCSDECARAAKLARRRVESRGWRDGHRNELRVQQLWTNYRMTVEDFEAQLTAQDGRCAICSTNEPGAIGWHIDHDHGCCPGRRSCGKCRRGILCGPCNRRVLAVVEGPLLARAVAYVEVWRGLRVD